MAIITKIRKCKKLPQPWEIGKNKKKVTIQKLKKISRELDFSKLEEVPDKICLDELALKLQVSKTTVRFNIIKFKIPYTKEERGMTLSKEHIEVLASIIASKGEIPVEQSKDS